MQRKFQLSTNQGLQAGAYEDNMKKIFCDVAPFCLVCENTDVSEQPTEEEVHTDDEDYSFLLKVCVKVKSGG